MTEQYCPAYGPGSPVCPRSMCDCFIDQFPDDMEAAGALHPEFFTVVAPDWFRSTPESERVLAEERAKLAAGTWEPCVRCGKEFAYPHLCRTHMLCGICHQEVPHDGIPF